MEKGWANVSPCSEMDVALLLNSLAGLRMRGYCFGETVPEVTALPSSTANQTLICAMNFCSSVSEAGHVKTRRQ
jgi:hypothetical protein